MMHHEDWDLTLLSQESDQADPAGVTPEEQAFTEADPAGEELSPAPSEAVPPREEGDAGLAAELLKRGVPPEKLEKHRKALERAVAWKTAGAADKGEDAAGNRAASEEVPEEKRPTLEKLLADPESRRILHDYANGIVRERVKNTGRDAAAYRALVPALQALAERHGMDSRDPDPGELNRRILAEIRPLYAEGRAPVKRGETPIPQTSPRQEAFLRAHFGALRQQEAELRKDYPTFDLGEALRNPAFVRMVAPDSPLTLEDAFFATHRQEILNDREQKIREQALEEASRALRAGQQRPRESGGSRGTTVTPSLSREQREDLKRRIHAAAARGEKIYPT